jgi:type I restriction enzyme S subunit
MSAISLNVLHSGAWEQFKIKDIAKIGRGRVISSIEISQQKNPTYPVYSSQTSNDGIMGYLDDYMFEGEYISWTTDGANAGTVFYRNGKFNCTNVCGLLKLRKEFDTHFVSLVLAEATKKYVSINLANPKLMNNTMGNIQIRLPKLEEQKRVSIVFRELQGLWVVYNSLLTNYTKQKQYLLSQMFI